MSVVYIKMVLQRSLIKMWKIVSETELWKRFDGLDWERSSLMVPHKAQPSQISSYSWSAYTCLPTRPQATKNMENLLTIANAAPYLPIMSHILVEYFAIHYIIIEIIFLRTTVLCVGGF